MKQTINEHQFIHAFEDMGRGNQFSYEGRAALFAYLTQLEEDTGEEIEFDVIALCCDYAEYENLAEFQKDYSTDYKTIEDIENETTVIPIYDSERFIIQQF